MLERRSGVDLRFVRQVASTPWPTRRLPHEPGPATQPPKTVQKPSSAPESIPPAVDRLGFYRLLASIPALASYRAKVIAVVVVGTLLLASLLVLAIVPGAGRMSAITLIVLVVLFAAGSAAALVWALGRLLAPLDPATDSIDDVSLEGPLARVDLPGSDAAAQILRGVQALVAHRVAAQRREAESRPRRADLTVEPARGARACAGADRSRDPAWPRDSRARRGRERFHRVQRPACDRIVVKGSEESLRLARARHRACRAARDDRCAGRRRRGGARARSR